MHVVAHTLVEVASPDDPLLRQFLDNVWEQYGAMSQAELFRLTHHSNSPWWKVRQTAQGMKTADIPLAVIAEYFGPLAENVRRRAA